MKGLKVLVVAVGVALLATTVRSAVIELNDKNFAEKVSDTSKAWFVEFFAPWCGHCKKLAPIWEQLASDVGRSINIAKVDCTANNNICRQHDIKGYPTIKLFRTGPSSETAHRYERGRTIEEFKRFLNMMRALAPPTITLRYFETRGRAEVIRLALEESRLPYTQVQYNSETWPAAKKEGVESGLFPFGQVPSLSIDEDNLVQTYAILRYIGRLSNILYPSEFRAAAKVDIMIEAVEDIRRKYAQLVYDSDFQAKKEAYIKEFMPQAFSYLNSYVTSVAGDGPFVLRHALSIADLALFDAMQCHLPLSPSLLSDYPRLSMLYQAVAHRPGIQAYLTSDRRPKFQNGKSAFFDSEQYPVETATASA